MAINTLELLVRRTAVLTRIPESICEVVLGFKWKSLAESLYDSTNVEDSGLGKFKVRYGVVKKNLNKVLARLKYNYQLLELEDDDKKRKTIEHTIKNLLIDQDYLLSKLYED